MLCEKCKKVEANTTITKNINGHVTIAHLCVECAAKQGLGAVGSVFGSMLGGIFTDVVGAGPVAKCKVCGSSLAEFTRTGKAGCPNCYTEFYPQLLPTLQKIHGKVKHVGKIGTVRDIENIKETTTEVESQKDQGNKTLENEMIEKKISDLKAQLSNAIEAQEFEQAVKLRDQIKTLE